MNRGKVGGRGLEAINSMRARIGHKMGLSRAGNCMKW